VCSAAAPFGYRYVRKSEQSAAYYEINEVKAPVGVARYTIDGLSIGAITRLLNEQRIPTRKQPAAGNARRSGPCCVTPPIKVLLASARHRPRHGNASPGRYACVAVLHRVTVHTHEWPRDEWIAIPVPPIIDEQTFALARERPKANKTHAPRRTVVPSVVQSLVSCANCSYTLYRTST
jgi:site-specific DNA recombinase